MNGFWRASRRFWSFHGIGWGMAWVTTTILERFEGTPFWVYFRFFVLMAGMGTLYGLGVRWSYSRYGQGKSLASLAPRSQWWVRRKMELRRKR